MATKKKMLQAAAGNAGGEALNVEEVFSTYLHTGTGAAKSIVNGVDLAGEGGLVWSKCRDRSRLNRLIDTERGVNKALISSATSSEETYTDTLTSFNSDGFTLGADASSDSFNRSPDIYATWTFRKAPKFFDVVTYTGNGTSGRSISHNLGCDVGFIAIKILNTSDNWECFHRGVTFNSGNVLWLNSANAVTTGASRFPTAPDSNNFYLGSDSGVNGNGNTYVAYIFAHNDGDGEFGADGDADIIKCGSYTGNESSFPTVNLGFEPQWVMIKAATRTSNWQIFDNMRGIATGGNENYLWANANEPEQSFNDHISLNATGFDLSSVEPSTNSTGETFIYMAIRRGTKVPESGTEVFDVDAYSGNSTAGRIIPSAFPVDLAIVQSRSAAGDTNAVADRLRGANLLLNTPSTDAELTNNSNSITGFDFMDGIEIGTDTRTNWSSGTYVSWMWKRAPGFFDVLAYEGNSTAGRTVSHNLTVVPEMMWIKSRNNARGWRVYHSSFTNGSVSLNSAASKDTSTNYFSTPTADNIILGTDNDTNRTAYTYIAYLFASLDGISKVGSYTGNGGSVIQTIDCGFTSGARFVLIKRSSGAGDWFVYDTERGITVFDTDGVLLLNSQNAEATESAILGGNRIIPHSSGFKVVGNDLNNGSYIFYAIA